MQPAKCAATGTTEVPGPGAGCYPPLPITHPKMVFPRFAWLVLFVGLVVLISCEPLTEVPDPDAGAVPADELPPGEPAPEEPPPEEPPQPFVANWYVDAAADAGTADGSLANPFVAIEDAVAVATSGQTIAVAGGSYSPTATIQLTAAVSLSGSWDSAFLEQTFNPAPTTAVRSTATVALDVNPDIAETLDRSTVLEGPDVETDQSGTFRAALKIRGAAAPTVRNSRFVTPNGGWGVWVRNTADPRIEDSYMLGMRDVDYEQAACGIYVQDSASVELVRNTAIGGLAPSNAGYGIGLDHQSGGSVLLINNTFWSGTIDVSGGISYGARILPGADNSSVTAYGNVFAGAIVGTSGSTIYAVNARSSNTNVDMTFVNNTVFTGDVGSAAVDTIGLGVLADDLVLINNLFARGADNAIGNPQYLIRFNPPSVTNTIELRNNAFSEPSGTVNRIYGFGSSVDTEAELNDFTRSTDLVGNPRPGPDGQWSIGAIEFQGPYHRSPTHPALQRKGALYPGSGGLRRRYRLRGSVATMCAGRDCTTSTDPPAPPQMA